MKRNNFWLKLLFGEDPVNIALGMVSISLSLLGYYATASQTIGLPWFLILLLAAIVCLYRMYKFARAEHLKNEELSAQLKEQIQGAMPKVSNFTPVPTFRLVASKSPLFIPNSEVTVVLRGEVHPDSETPLCLGRVVHLHTSDKAMEIAIDTNSLEPPARERIRNILSDRSYYPNLFIIPGKITEQQE